MNNYKYDNNQILSEDIKIITNNIKSQEKIIFKNVGLMSLLTLTGIVMLPFGSPLALALLADKICFNSMKKQLNQQYDEVEKAEERVYKLDKQLPFFDKGCIMVNASTNQIITKSKTKKIDKTTKKIINDFYFFNTQNKPRILREIKTVVDEDTKNQIVDYQINLIETNKKKKEKRKTF